LKYAARLRSAAPRVAWLCGDGIGHEVLEATRSVLDAAGVDLEYMPADIGWRFWCEEGDALPLRTLAVIAATDCALFGAITSKPAAEAAAELTPRLHETGLAYRSPIVRLRQMLDLFANVRPAAAHPHSPRGVENLVVFRENTEGLYAGIEIYPTSQELLRAIDSDGVLARYRELPDDQVALSVRVVSSPACERIVRAAFEFAKANGRRRVTVVEKPNVLKATGGLMIECARRVAAEFSSVEFQIANIDTACMDLVRKPREFDVIVAENLFGDILSDLVAGLAGGPGLAPSANIGDRYAIFEPVHGSAPDIAGRGIANPCAAVLSAAMMLDWLGDGSNAARLRRAVHTTLDERLVRTADLGGVSTTKQMASAIAEAVSRL